MTASDQRQDGEGLHRQGLTIAKIANLAGVSAPTVSRVLNGQAGVALSTRQRVEDVLREYGYRRRESGSAAILELVFHALESLWALRSSGVSSRSRGNTNSPWCSPRCRAG